MAGSYNIMVIFSYHNYCHFQILDVKNPLRNVCIIPIHAHYAQVDPKTNET